MLNSDYTFENYIIPDNNKLLQEIILPVVTFSGRAYNPLFIYGATGVGRTHLTQAITRRIMENNPALEIFYTTCEGFINHMVRSFQNYYTEDFRDFYQSLDILLIDDIHFMKGKRATQEEFFIVLNNLYEAKKQIVISGDKLPENIFSVSRESIDIFKEGLIIELKLPGYQDRLNFVSKKAKEMDLEIPDEVLERMSHRDQLNFRELKGVLHKLHLHENRCSSCLPKESK